MGLRMAVWSLEFICNHETRQPHGNVYNLCPKGPWWHSLGTVLREVCLSPSHYLTERQLRITASFTIFEPTLNT
jgi:hypothetical protein